MRILITTLLCFVAFALAPAEAKHYRHHSSYRHHTTYHHHHFVPIQRPDDIFAGLFSNKTQTSERQGRRLMAYAPSTGGGYNSVSTPAISYSHPREVAESRPSDCYGIAWCGCWLKHHLGIVSSKLNLNRAIEWAHLGSSTRPHAGAVVVWHHHVGKMTSEPDSRGYAVVLSGNSGGRTGVTEVRRYIGNAVAFRDI